MEALLGCTRWKKGGGGGERGFWNKAVKASLLRRVCTTPTTPTAGTSPSPMRTRRKCSRATVRNWCVPRKVQQYSWRLGINIRYSLGAKRDFGANLRSAGLLLCRSGWWAARCSKSNQFVTIKAPGGKWWTEWAIKSFLFSDQRTHKKRERNEVRGRGPRFL